MSNFNKLSALNVNDKVEKKNGLSYLTWSWAWSEFVKEYPDATYEVVKFDGLPYVVSDAGAMCYTKVTAGNITHEMWLPVMDGANKAMKQEAYEYSTRNGNRTVQAFTMFDVNKTIMRCLVKNLAMFGLGLYIYAGEDLPTDENGEVIKNYKTASKQTPQDKKEYWGEFTLFCKMVDVDPIEFLTDFAQVNMDNKNEVQNMVVKYLKDKEMFAEQIQNFKDFKLSLQGA